MSSLGPFSQPKHHFEHHFENHLFLCLRYKVTGGIMFSGCPSVRTSRSCDRVISRTDWWITAKLESGMYLAKPMNWLDFGVTRSKFKGHRAHYVCKIACDRVISRTDWWVLELESGMYLAKPMNWLDFGVTRSKFKGHRAHYVCKIACDRVISRTDWWVLAKLE